MKLDTEAVNTTQLTMKTANRSSIHVPDHPRLGFPRFGISLGLMVPCCDSDSLELAAEATASTKWTPVLPTNPLPCHNTLAIQADDGQTSPSWADLRRSPLPLPVSKTADESGKAVLVGSYNNLHG